MKKKVVSLTLCIALAATMITGCGNTQAAGSAAPAEEATAGETATGKSAKVSNKDMLNELGLAIKRR